MCTSHHGHLNYTGNNIIGKNVSVEMGLRCQETSMMWNYIEKLFKSCNSMSTIIYGENKLRSCD